jgi:hypothetical protein
MTSCASTKAVVEPEVETATSPPLIDQAPGPPTGPPPGHVEPKNYVVREKIILGEVTTVIDREVSTPSEPAPPVSATQKNTVKKAKKNKKTVKKVSWVKGFSCKEIAMHITEGGEKPKLEKGYVRFNPSFVVVSDGEKWFWISYSQKRNDVEARQIIEIFKMVRFAPEE